MTPVRAEPEDVVHAKLKALLRAAASHAVDALWRAIGHGAYVPPHREAL
jgi:hypothetical protein